MKLITHVSKCDFTKLLEEAQELEYWLDGSSARMAVTQSGGIPDPLLKYKEIMRAVQEIADIRKTPAYNIMINSMDPETSLPKHRDWIKATTHQKDKPIVERWHLPILTNSGCRWWGEKTGFVPMKQGIWYGPMPYWQLHNFENNGNQERIHLVVDLDTPNRIGIYDEERSS